MNSLVILATIVLNNIFAMLPNMKDIINLKIVKKIEFVIQRCIF